MAGSFGFERGEHAEVAVKAGERVLLPRVRQAAADTLVLADGFSCRTQIEQGSDRRALHLAEVLRLAMRAEQGRAPAARPPELANDAIDASVSPHRNGSRRTVAVGAAGASAIALAAFGLRRRQRC